MAGGQTAGGQTAGGRWRRRREARPGEITQAALAVFAQRGFAAARMADIADRAGLSKAALYVYFPTKAELFRAVLTHHAAPRLQAVREMGAAPPSFAAALDTILDALVGLAQAPELRKLARMVATESGNFPELASLWREKVVSPSIGAVTAAVARAQTQGEVGAGDPRLLAFSIVGPLVVGLLWREVMEPSGGEALDVEALARQHRAVLRAGLPGLGSAGTAGGGPGGLPDGGG